MNSPQISSNLEDKYQFDSFSQHDQEKKQILVPQINVLEDFSLLSHSEKKLISQNFDQYQQFFAHFMDKNYTLKTFPQIPIQDVNRLSFLDIPLWTAIFLEINRYKLQNHSIFFNYEIQSQTAIEIMSSSLHSKIIRIKVSFSYLVFYIEVLNVQSQFKQFSRQFQKLQEGSYGQIFVMKDESTDQEIVFKKIDVKSDTKLIIVQSFENMKSCLRQFCIYKLMSTVEMGLKIPNIFGFDIVCFQESVIFPMEYAKSFSDVPISSLQIIHKDIKPHNFMWSPSLEKMVLIDFGLSEACQQKMGFKTLTGFMGTYNYCTPEMKVLYYKKQKRYIDIYWNDAVTLQLSMDEIEKQLDFKKKYDNSKNKNEDCQLRFIETCQSISSEAEVSYDILRLIEIAYGFYAGSQWEIKMLFRKLDAMELSQEFLSEVVNFLKDLKPSLKLFQVFNENIKPLLKCFPELKDQNVSQISTIYKKMKNIYSVKPSFDEKIERKNKAYFENVFCQQSSVRSKRIENLLSQIIKGPENEDFFRYDMSFLSLLQIIDFYDSEENILKEGEVQNFVYKFGRKRFNLSKTESLMSFLFECLKRIRESTQNYLIDFNCGDKEMENNKSQDQMKEILFELYEQSMGISKEETIKKYERFKQRKKSETIGIYSLQFILYTMPKILERICTIEFRLGAQRQFILRMEEYCFLTRDIDEIVTSFYRILCLYVNCNKMIDLLNSIIEDFNYIFSFRYKQTFFEHRLQLMKKKEKAERFKEKQKKKEKVEYMQQKADQQYESDFKIKKENFQTYSPTKLINPEHQDQLQIFWLKVPQKLQKYYELNRILNQSEYFSDSDFNHQKLTIQTAIRYKSNIETLFFLGQFIAQKKSIMLKLVLVIFVQIYLWNKILDNTQKVNYQRKRKQLKNIIRFFINYIPSKDCQIPARLKQIMMADLEMTLVRYADQKEIIDTHFHSSTHDIYKTINLDYFKQTFYYLMAYDYSAHDREFFNTFSPKISMTDVFGSPSILSYSIQMRKKSAQNTVLRSEDQEEIAVAKTLNHQLKLFNEKLTYECLKGQQPLNQYMKVILRPDKDFFFSLNDLSPNLDLSKFSYSLIFSKFNYLTANFRFLKSFKMINFYYNAIKYLLRKLNEDLNNLMSEKEMIALMAPKDKDHMASIMRQLNGLQTDQYLSQGQKKKIQKQKQWYLMMLEQKVYAIESGFADRKSWQYPSYYWLTKSYLVKNKHNLVYQVLYLDLVFMSQNYKGSVSKKLYNQIGINKIFPTTNSQLTPEEIWIASPHKSLNYFELDVYRQWLQMAAFCNNSQSDQFFTFSNQLIFGIHSQDTYNRFLSLQSFIAFNKIQNEFHKPPFHVILTLMFQSFLLHQNFTLLIIRFKSFLEYINCFQFNFINDLSQRFIHLLNSFTLPSKSIESVSYSSVLIKEKLSKFFFSILHQGIHHFHLWKFVYRNNIQTLLSSVSKANNLQIQYHNQLQKNQSQKINMNCLDDEQSLEQIILLMFLSLQVLTNKTFEKSDPHKEVGQKLFTYEIGILKRKSMNVECVLKEQPKVQYRKCIQKYSQRADQFQFLSHGIYSIALMQMSQLYIMNFGWKDKKISKNKRVILKEYMKKRANKKWNQNDVIRIAIQRKLQLKAIRKNLNQNQREEKLKQSKLLAFDLS